MMSENLSPALHPTANEGDQELFASLAERWWDVNGPFRPLHHINPVRLALLRDKITAHFEQNPRQSAQNQANSGAQRDLLPFKGLKILDIGCGGGLIAEPMARLGGNVTGIDTVGKNIAAAKIHAEQSGLSIDYRLSSSSELWQNGEKFDVVLALEVVEHVTDPERFIHEAAGLLQPGGMIILSTLNRKVRSFILAIIGAEYVMGLLPRGTHDWRKFQSPATLAAWLRKAEIGNMEFYGLSYDLWQRKWSITKDLRVNYFVIASKEKG
ncbi:MAG: bifunctional 2-polyprenyl-6-hydroxyphenol methylase/3-demethylubiquinol 3-O-methyltransferase UbiG [Alphaproteobacteria bacterium]|nr:bifunctional 2-polyprenyl-6-hydroxyphenol methylase/3-demethylubiquinol 3-O-methyltransferase UbiG [Alphaproteobacteria bacterium]